jgi:hypothetical protein
VRPWVRSQHQKRKHKKKKKKKFQATDTESSGKGGTREKGALRSGAVEVSVGDSVEDQNAYMAKV